MILENVRIFNGTAARLSAPSNVLVVGNIMKTIPKAPIADSTETAVTRIRAGGRSLTPGLIGAAAIADNPDSVRQRAREQLALGASQIKLMARGWGGVQL